MRNVLRRTSGGCIATVRPEAHGASWARYKGSLLMGFVLCDVRRFPLGLRCLASRPVGFHVSLKGLEPATYRMRRRPTSLCDQEAITSHPPHFLVGFHASLKGLEPATYRMRRRSTSLCATRLRAGRQNLENLNHLPGGRGGGGLTASKRTKHQTLGRARGVRVARCIFCVRKGCVKVKYSGATRARSLCFISQVSRFCCGFSLGRLRRLSRPRENSQQKRETVHTLFS